MNSPVNLKYTGLSGAALYAGRAAPAPAPAPGPPPPPPPPAPPAQSITLTALGGLSATAGGASLNFSAQVANATGLPLNFALETVSGPTATPTPSSSTWSTGDLNKAISAAWAAAGTSVIRVRDANNALSNSLSVTVVAAPTPPPPPPPPSPATSVTIALSSSTGTTGSPTSGTATLNGTAPSTGTVTLVGAGATFTSSPISWTAGEAGAAKSFTVQRAADGTTTVSSTNTMGLTNLGGGSYTSSTSAPGSTFTTPTVTPIAASGSIGWTIGHAFKIGHVPAGAGLAGLQLDVISTHDDGSARFAQVSGVGALSTGTAANVALATGVAASGPALTLTDLKATSVTANVDAGAFGSAAWSGTDWDSPFEQWAAGPVMSAWVFRKQIGSDAHLVAWLQVNLYSTGNVRVLPWIENGYLTVAAPTNKSATYTFTLAGTSRFSAAIDLLNHQRTPLVSGAALYHWLGADHTVRPAHSATYLASTEQVPDYYPVTPDSSLIAGLPATFTPLQQGSMPTGMGSGGYHPSIGLLPQWDVLYLLSANTTIYSAVVRNGYSAGRYGIHFRDQATNKPLRFSSYPTLVLGSGNGVSSVGASTTGNNTPAATGGSPPTYANTHAPAMGYMAALLTGDYYHVETTQFQATVHFLKNGDASNARNGTAGLFRTTAGANTTRGAAWSLRTLAYAIAVSKDAGPVKAELVSSWQSNIAYYHARYVGQTNNPFGFVTPYVDYTAPQYTTAQAGSTSTVLTFASGQTYETDDYYLGYEVVIGGEVRTCTAYVGATRTLTVSPAFTVPTASQPTILRYDNILFGSSWQQDFFTSAVGMAKAMRIPVGGVAGAQLDEFFDWKARSVVGRLGTVAADEYLYRDAAPYTISVAPVDSPDFNTGTGPWYANWGEIWAATQAANVTGTKVQGDGSLRGGNIPAAFSYWGNMQPALAYAVRHGVAGSSAGRNLMMTAPNWATLQANFATAPEWGVRPHRDPQAMRPAAGFFKNISNNTMLAIQPGDWPTSEQAGPFANWCGGAFIEDAGDNGTLDITGSGHLASGNSYAGVWRFDVTTGLWSGRNLPSAAMPEWPAVDFNLHWNAFWESTDAWSLGHVYNAHVYDGMIAVLQREGGGPDGSLIRASIGGGARVTHKWQTGSLTAPPVRLLDVLPSMGTNSYPMSARDPKRGGWWSLSANGNGRTQLRDFATAALLIDSAAAFNEQGDFSMCYVPFPYDMLLAEGLSTAGAGGFNTIGVYVCPIVANVPTGWVKVTQSGPYPADQRLGVQWDKDLGKAVSYQGNGSYLLHKLTLPTPANKTSGTYTWATETLAGESGATPANHAGTQNGSWGRWVPTAFGCGIWANGLSQPVQLWRSVEHK